MEHCPEGDLREQITKAEIRNKKIKVDLAIDWSFQIMSALKYCHDRKIMHRDLKVRN